MTIPQRTAPQFPRYTGDEHVLVWDEHETDHNDIADSIGGTTGLVLTGTGTPEAAVAAPVGTLYLDSAGTTSLTLYVKETGTDTNLGWVAK